MDSKESKDSKSKKNSNQNPFDFSSMMGYPPMGTLPSPFPLLGPNPMFPFFPFGGMGAPGDGLLSSDGAEWWKMASEQAKKLAENMSELYPGMNSMYGGNPFMNPFAVPGLSSASTNSRISSTPSPNASHHKSLHSTPDGIFNGAKQPSNNSSPVSTKEANALLSKTPKEPHRAGSVRSSRTRTDSESSTVVSPRNPSESSTPVKQLPSHQEQMLKKSSISNDSSLYSSAPFFFPFGPMAFGGMTFPGAASMFGSPNDYMPPFNNLFLGASGLKPPSGLSLESSKSNNCSGKSSTSRSSQGYYQTNSDLLGTSPYFINKNKNDSNEAGKRDGSSATSVIVSKHSFSLPGTSARTLSIADHKLQLGAFKSKQDFADRNKKLKNISKNTNEFKGIQSEASSLSGSGYFRSNSPAVRTFSKISERRESSSSDTVNYSQDGAIDLSIKKPRLETPVSSSSTSKNFSSGLSKSTQPEAADILSALAQSHQMFSKSSSSFGDPLSSFNMAAALLPQMYENMFYSPFSSEGGSSRDNICGDRKGRRGRKRGEQTGKGRGGRSMFISSMMAADAHNTHKDNQSSAASTNDDIFKHGTSSSRSFADHYSLLDQHHSKLPLSMLSGKESLDKETKLYEKSSDLFSSDLFNFDLPSSLRYGDLSSDTESSEAASDEWAISDVQKGQDVSRKRKRESYDEKLLKAPLQQGWQRETKITGVTNKKLIGQVAYETPTGQRILTFDDVDKYLQASPSPELSKKNFSFNANINLGKFFEQQTTDEKGQKDFVPLSEVEAAEKFAALEVRKRSSAEKKKLRLVHQQMLFQHQQHLQEHLHQQNTDSSVNKKLEQGLSSRCLEDKVQEDQHQEKDVLKMKQMKALEEVRKVRDVQKLQKMQQQQQQQSYQLDKVSQQQQDKMSQQQQQQVKMQRDAKLQHFIEDKEKKQNQMFIKDQSNAMSVFGTGDLQYYSYLLQAAHKQEAQEQHKQIFGLERERRKHYLLLVKAIDARKKEEEKERMREEKRCAKKLDREKKMEQRRMELYLARELKKPTEDLLLQDSKSMPELERVSGLKLCGKAFADCLMILEFAHNFAANLKLENEMLPTMTMLQEGLLNESPVSVDSFATFIIHLLKLAIDDPGFPNPREAVTQSGQKVSEIELNKFNISEILRVFIRARSGKEDEMAEWLRMKPYQALNASEKTTILSYICHELLTSKVITNEIEKSIDIISNLKKDKWIIEGKLRKYRMLQAKRLRRVLAKSQLNEDSNTTTNTCDNNNKKDTDDEQSILDSNDEALQTHDSDAEDDQTMPLEELESKIDKLTKQYNSYQDKVLTLSHKLSIVPLGQDRYRRLYWVFPKCGGLYVEGIESCEPEMADLTTDVTNMLQPPDLAPPILEPQQQLSLSADNQSNDNNNSSNPPTPISCCSKVNNIADVSDIKTENKLLSSCSPAPALDANPEEENNSKENLTKPCLSEKSETLVDASESTITNLEDIIARTVMNSMMEDNVNQDGYSPYIDGLSADGSKLGLPDLKPKLGELDLISKFLASSDNEDDKVAQSPSTKSELLRKEFFPNKSSFSFDRLKSLMSSHKDGGGVESDGLKKEVKDEFEMVKKKLAYSIDRGSWFSLFAQMNGCGPHASSKQNHTTKDAGTQDLKTLVDRSISSTPTTNSRSSTPINPRPGCEEEVTFAEWEAKMVDVNNKQIPPEIQLEKQRGWWKISDGDQLKLILHSMNTRGIREKILQKFLEKNFDFITQSCFKLKKNIMKLDPASSAEQNFTGSLQPNSHDTWNFKLHRRIELDILTEVENLEEKVCNASLQGWRMSPRTSQDASENLVASFEKDLRSDEKHILDVARSKLLHLEHNIERRYLKPPLGRSNHLNLSSLTSSNNHESDDDDSDPDDETATKELSLWRSAVASSTSSSQLFLYVVQLNRCIAWEKSIMKVSCQICCCDDNEAELLLCDMCDRGYHTYCIKPKLQSVPEGDWFCYECISKASGDTCCVACGKHEGRFVVCETCKRRAHSSCLDPPLTRVPKRWCCHSCLSDKLKSKKKLQSNKFGLSSTLTSSSIASPLTPGSSASSSSSAATSSSSSSSSQLTTLPQMLLHGNREHDSLPRQPQSSETNGESASSSLQDDEEKSKTETSAILQTTEGQPRCEKLRIDLKKRLQAEKALRSPDTTEYFDTNGDLSGTDLSVCHTILSEMKKHEDAWPFLTPVSSKQFPTYRKIIRCPIDFQTISKRLKINYYKTREEFACDARLVFNNCEMFNEDDSTVGRAGHSMQDFFERRWNELTNNNKHSSQLLPPPPPPPPPS